MMHRYSTSSPAQRVAWAIRVRKGFRLPQNVARRWHGQKPIETEFSFPGLRAAHVPKGIDEVWPAAAQMDARPILLALPVFLLEHLPCVHSDS